MQTVGVDGNTVRTSVPRAIVEREARKQQLTIDEFIARYKLVWLFDGFTGAYAVFELILKPDTIATIQQGLSDVAQGKVSKIDLDAL